MKDLVIIRGGGDIATGTIHKLFNCKYNILVLENSTPSAIRRHIAFSEAVYDGTTIVDGVEARLINSIDEFTVQHDFVQILVDETGSSISQLKPKAVVDAILAKKNLGTHKDMADFVICLGPGFEAGNDCDFVIETKRGHDLGRIISLGMAVKNSGIPGIIGGYGKERVIHSKYNGILKNLTSIGDTVKQGQVIATVENNDGVYEIYASIDGLLRGLIRDNYPVTKGFKIADIDPRISEYKNCFTISDKANCIAGGVLECLLANDVRP